MTCVLLVVFDGLRPDMIRPDITPNLMRFAALGTTMARARSVFPSETRVCTASVATGCHPRRHGIVANRMLHPADCSRFVETGDGEALARMEQECGVAAVLQPGLSDVLAKMGQEYAVFSSGSTGQSFILAPKANLLGQLVLSGHGARASSARGQRLLERLSPPPTDPTARAVWIAEAWRTTQICSPPPASVLWLCEPDTSAHYDGLDSTVQRRKLTEVDAAFGRILDDWQDGPQREHLQIIVASDHGHVTIDGVFALQTAFGAEHLLAGCSFTGGGSGGIAVPDGEPGRISDIAGWLMRQDVVANVFATDASSLPLGLLPRSAVLLDHPRAADVLYTLRNSDHRAATGLPGTSLSTDNSGLLVGAGTHGGLNRAELSTVLMLAGSAINPSHVSDQVAGLADIAPTILALLGIAGGEAMDGRVMHEAFGEGVTGRNGCGPQIVDTMQTEGGGYAQRLTRVRQGRHVWIDHAIRI